MKKVTVIFEQTSSRKGIATISRLTSNEIIVKDNEGTIKFVNQFVGEIKNVVESVLVTGNKYFLIGGHKFSLTKKMTFELVVDGEKFTLGSVIGSNVFTLDKENFTVSFKHLDKLAVNLFMTIQGSKGLNLLPTAQNLNQLNA
jgi:hypothetical protein